MRNNSNNNKFYIIQILLEDSNPNNHYVFKRWGRTGEQGLQACRGPITRFKAIEEY
jgi:predicted DNA-binding WGR domain protein